MWHGSHGSDLYEFIIEVTHVSVLFVSRYRVLSSKQFNSKQILWQTVETNMKCRIRCNFIWACTVCVDKTIFRDRNALTRDQGAAGSSLTCGP